MDHAHGGTRGGHDREPSSWRRLVHLASQIFGAHAHDTIGQVDESLETSDEGRRALLISLAVLAATAALQGVVVVVSGSVALLGDSLHHVVDALTAVPLLVAFQLERRVPTRRYTYGYGRAEDLAGMFVIAMIALSAVVAGWEAASQLAHPREVTHLWAVAVAALIGFLGNEIVARFRVAVGRRIGSAALVADGLHARTDGFTSLAVLLGAAGVALGWRWADPVIALVITVVILGVLRSAARQVFARLMDAVDPALVDQIQHVLSQTAGVRRVEAAKVRWIGHSLHAEASITVDPAASLAVAHAIAHESEHHLLHTVHRLTGATVHAGPDEPHPVAHQVAAHHRRS